MYPSLSGRGHVSYSCSVSAEGRSGHPVLVRVSRCLWLCLRDVGFHQTGSGPDLKQVVAGFHHDGQLA